MRTQFYVAGLIAVSLAVGSFVMASSAAACKGKGTQSASQAKGLHGKIVSVNNNSITVAIHRHHKKGQAGAAAGANAAQATETVQIGANTRIAFVGGKNAKAATVNDLKPGEEVMIQGSGNMAQKIGIMHHEHHKKAAA